MQQMQRQAGIGAAWPATLLVAGIENPTNAKSDIVIFPRLKKKFLFLLPTFMHDACFPTGVFHGLDVKRSKAAADNEA